MLAGIAALCTAPSALACVSKPMTDQTDLFERSDVVFEGTVRHTGALMGRVRTRFTVHTVRKGQIRQAWVGVTHKPSNLCGTDYRVGQRRTVHARRGPFGRLQGID